LIYEIKTFDTNILSISITKNKLNLMVIFKNGDYLYFNLFNKKFNQISNFKFIQNSKLIFNYYLDNLFYVDNQNNNNDKIDNNFDDKINENINNNFDDKNNENIDKINENIEYNENNFILNNNIDENINDNGINYYEENFDLIKIDSFNHFKITKTSSSSLLNNDNIELKNENNENVHNDKIIENNVEIKNEKNLMNKKNGFEYKNISKIESRIFGKFFTLYDDFNFYKNEYLNHDVELNFLLNFKNIFEKFSNNDYFKLFDLINFNFTVTDNFIILFDFKYFIIIDYYNVNTFSIFKMDHQHLLSYYIPSLSKKNSFVLTNSNIFSFFDILPLNPK
jgi:hypothetical protein